jgi:hypothetical protein
MTQFDIAYKELNTWVWLKHLDEFYSVFSPTYRSA